MLLGIVDIILSAVSIALHIERFLVGDVESGKQGMERLLVSIIE